MHSEKCLMFLCPRAAKAGVSNLSFRIAMELEATGVGDVGTLQDLSEQHVSGVDGQKNMIFIDDCRSGCVKVLTHGFRIEKYVYFDVSAFAGSTEFDIPQFVHGELLPKVAAKWGAGFFVT